MVDVQYTKYYVAFLDILGFKNLVNGPEATCQSILSIYQGFDVMQKTYFGNDYGEAQDVKMKVMSDSICLYIEADKPNALWSLISFCTVFQYDLLTIPQHIFVRGGIALGDMFVENDIVFGPALTQAYLLEEKNAKVPRIIILKETLEYGKKQADKDAADLMEISTFRDDDAFYVLNYFVLLCFNDNNEKIVDQIKAVVSDYLDSTIDESIRQKYLYVENKICKYLKENPNA